MYKRLEALNCFSINMSTGRMTKAREGLEKVAMAVTFKTGEDSLKDNIAEKQVTMKMTAKMNRKKIFCDDPK
jgi:hypothetical protein